MLFHHTYIILHHLMHKIFNVISISIVVSILASLQQGQKDKPKHAKQNISPVEAFIPCHNNYPIFKSFVLKSNQSPTSIFSKVAAHETQYVKNPMTNRNILKNRKTYKDIMDRGGYILHNNELLPIHTQYLMNSFDDITQEIPLNIINEDDQNRNLFQVLTPQIQPTINSTNSNNKPYDQNKAQKYISNNYLFINKDSHVHTVPPRNNNATSISSHFSSTNTKICHRLDKDTSGILILAHTSNSHSEMSKLFQNRQIKKSYIALIHGILPRNKNEYDIIDLPIGKEYDVNGYNKWVINGTNPRNAITHYKVLKQYTKHNYTKVLLHPQTGRGHQLRLHLMAIGHSILGDTLHYNSLDSVKAMPWRLCLHAWRVEFVLEEIGCAVVVESPSPF